MSMAWKWPRSIVEVLGSDYQGPKTAQEVRGLAGFLMLQRDQLGLHMIRDWVRSEWRDEAEKFYLLDGLNCSIDYIDFLNKRIDDLEKNYNQLNRWFGFAALACLVLFVAQCQQ